MNEPTIFIIRHGEKPAGEKQGVTLNGKPSDNSLIAEGWQRAGALVGLFGATTSAGKGHPLATPATIFAACSQAKGADGKDKSKREEETAGPLAQRLGLETLLTYGKGQGAELAEAARQATGPVLIVWDHSEIIAITSYLSKSVDIPREWPSDRFDVVFVLSPSENGYDFSQVPQELMAGDKALPIT